MTKEEALQYIESKGDTKFVIRTEDEDLTFLQNYTAQIEGEKIPAAQRKIYDELDEELFKITGQKRNQDNREKTSEFYKRVISTYKTDAEKKAEYEKEINSLKQQIKDGTGDKKTVADLEAVQKAYKELQEEKEKEVSTLKNEYQKYKMRSEISGAISGMTFKKNIPETAVKAVSDQVVNDLLGIAEYQDGKLVFMKDGAIMRNPHNALNPYTAKELLEERLKDVRDTARKIDGGPDLSKEIVKEYDDNRKLKKVSLIIPDSVKTKEDLSKHLVQAGLLRGTEEYFLAYKEYSANLPTH